jgi:hypothetical protein
MDFIESCAVIVASIVAVFSINAWRREYVGKRRAELAEDVLAMFYEAADVIRDIRHPAAFQSETAEVVQGEGESEDAYQVRRRASIVHVRYARHQEMFNKLRAYRYRFMAYFGRESIAPFNELFSIVAQIQVAAGQLAHLWLRSHFHSEDDEIKHQDRIRRFEDIFWDTFEDTDPINTRLNSLIDQVELICRAEIIGSDKLLNANWGKLRSLALNQRRAFLRRVQEWRSNTQDS